MSKGVNNVLKAVRSVGVTDSVEELKLILDSINNKTRELTKTLFDQGVLTDDQNQEIRNIRLVGHKIMKRKIKDLTEENYDNNF